LWAVRIAVIPGDGIGKEVTAEAVKILSAVAKASGWTANLTELPWGADHFLTTGVSMPPNGYAMLRDDFEAILLGAMGDPRVPDNRQAREILLGTRFELDLYVNYRPVRLLDDRLSPLKDKGVKDINFVVFRENTEGSYVSVGGRFKAGTEDEVAIQEEINTFKGVNRIIATPSSSPRSAASPRSACRTRAMRCRRGMRSGSACSARSLRNTRRFRPRISSSTRSHSS
jgi:3-isopropylmalate dehydrogenase